MEAPKREHSIVDDREVYDLVQTMLGELSNEAVAELAQGNGNDVERVIDSLYLETRDVMSNGTRALQKDVFEIEGFSDSVEETLRCRSLNYFTLTVLPEFIMGWHNIQWSDMIQMYRLLCVLASRDHGKSYHYSFAYPLWQMFRHKNQEMMRAQGMPGKVEPEYKMAGEGMLVTNEYKLGIELLAKVKTEIDANDILKERLMPDSKRDGWGAEKIIAKNGATFYVRSANSKIRGLHPSWIVLDDFLNESSLYSQEMRDKYWNIFSGVIYPALSPGGQMLIVGTPFFEKDLYGILKERASKTKLNEEAFRVFEYPAIFPDGTLLFPERHSLESILEKRNLLGSMIFSREILVTPIADSASIFPYTILNNAIKGQDNVKVIRNIDSSPRKYEKIIVGCDFAISSETGADYTVFTILGVDELGLFHVLNSVRLHGANYNKQMAALKKINRDFRPDIFVAESNGLQQIFVDMMTEANLPVVGDNTTSGNKKSLYTGVPGLAVLFETGRIKFPYGDEKSKAMTDLYFGELNSIAFLQEKGKLESTSQHDDTSMSLWQAVKGAKQGNIDFNFTFLGSQTSSNGY